MPHEANKHLDRIGALFENGALEVVIDSTYPLEHVPEALERFGSGMVNGKIIIEIEPDQAGETPPGAEKPAHR